MAHEDPLIPEVSKSLVTAAIPVTTRNPRGRPTQSKSIRFCPQPRSIVSQLLLSNIAKITNKTDLSHIHNERFQSDTGTAESTTDSHEIRDSNVPETLSQNQTLKKKKRAKWKVRNVNKYIKQKASMSTGCSKDLPLVLTTRYKDDMLQAANGEYCCGHDGCNYKSRLLTNLTKHKRLHSNERPYMCDQCTFRSNYVNSLKVHKRTHTSERPYCCHQCGYRCNSTSNLKKHIQHRHKAVDDTK